jgi:hypothetical protein
MAPLTSRSLGWSAFGEQEMPATGSLIISWTRGFMYNFPPNSKDFKRGYRLGIEKGKNLERQRNSINIKIALVLVAVFVLAFELLS